MPTLTGASRGAGLAAVIAVALAAVFVGARATVPAAPVPVVSGPWRVVDGVSVGFAHTEAGAEAAAAHYLLTIERAVDTLDLAETDVVARLLATRAEAQAIAEHAASVIGVERAEGAPLRRVAISTQLSAYSPRAAQVTVLETWIYATSSREALWAIERVGLVWQAGGWRVSAITGAARSQDESLAQLRAQLSFPGPGDASVR